MALSAAHMKIAGRRAALNKYALRFTLVAFAVCLAILGLQHATGADEPDSRRKLSGNYPEGVCDTYVYTNYKWIVLGLLLWGIYYMFWGLAIVCDDYFVASLEEICDALGLSADVAGATFMAAGSSAPELFTSLMGVFAVHNDVGVGTIVGSAVFNLCCIIGGTAIFTPGTLQIDWKPITRDTFFYAISIVAMLYVVADGEVTTKESLALVGTYFLYVIVMYFNQSIMKKIDECTGKATAASDGHTELDGKGDEEEEEEPGPISQAVAAPVSALMEWTIPDCTKDEKKSLYMVTFLASIGWIGILSYYMVEWASKVGCILNVHPAIMGCTLLAAGTSVPDAIGSLLVAKNGQGDMAVSNAIGSNVFDILLGLGIPWALNDIIFKNSIHVDASNLLPLSFILFFTLVGVYVVTALVGFKLSTPLGIFFFSLYFVFVAYNLLHEFNFIDF